MTTKPSSSRSRRLVAATIAVTAVGFVSLASHVEAATAAPTSVTAQIIGTDLEVTGSAANDGIVLRLQAGNPGSLEVIVGPTRAPAFRFRRSEFNRIVVRAGSGDDTVRIDEAAGVFTDTEATTLDGDDGRDQLTGGAGAEVFAGDTGNDTIDGNGAADVVLLGPGDDAVVWATGDGNDVVEGQGGADVVTVAGSGSSEQFNLSAVGERVRLFRDVDLVNLDLAGITGLRLQLGAGADHVAVNDLTGTSLADVELDLAGDGQPDRVTTHGGAAADTLGVAGVPGRVDVTGGATAVHLLNPDGPVDQLNVLGEAGADTITTAPAIGALVSLHVDGGSAGDTVVSNGTPGLDTLVASAPAGRVRVSDGTGRFHEATAETILVGGLAGNDTLSVAGDLGPFADVLLDGGDGDDTLTGGPGDDFLVGGLGRDTVRGGPGSDVAYLGEDDDRFDWVVGDGNDMVDGQLGSDFLRITGSGLMEDADISALGSRIIYRNTLYGATVDYITLDLNGIETLRYEAAGGSDFIGVGNLSGTDLTQVTLDLSSPPGTATGDGANDRLFVAGTHGNDYIIVSGSTPEVNVDGLPARISIRRPDFPIDHLQIDTYPGPDTVNQALLTPNTIGLTVL